MTLQEHIDELRAELGWNDDREEIRRIEAELQAALEDLHRQQERD